jgi:hypothetical protein
MDFTASKGPKLARYAASLVPNDMKHMLRDAFERWKDALVDQSKQTTQAARHRAHARVTSMEDLIAETPADDMRASASSWRFTSI